jgi:ketosteroid isomerase-like protein
MSASTEEVFDRHLQAFGAGDVERLLADYTEDSFVIGPMGVIKGLAGLRGFFEQLCREFAGAGTVFTLQQRVIEGEFVYITWSAETSANTYSFGTDTFVIRNGKFVGQTFAGVITPKA